MWESTKMSNIHIISIWEGEKKEQSTKEKKKERKEIEIKNYSNLSKNTPSYRFKKFIVSPGILPPPQSTSRHIIIQLLTTNDKEKNLKVPREK